MVDWHRRLDRVGHFESDHGHVVQIQLGTYLLNMECDCEKGQQNQLLNVYQIVHIRTFLTVIYTIDDGQ